MVNQVERLATTPRFSCVTIRLAPLAAGGGERGKAENCYLARDLAFQPCSPPSKLGWGRSQTVCLVSRYGLAPDFFVVSNVSRNRGLAPNAIYFGTKSEPHALASGVLRGIVTSRTRG